MESCDKDLNDCEPVRKIGIEINNIKSNLYKLEVYMDKIDDKLEIIKNLLSTQNTEVAVLKNKVETLEQEKSVMENRLDTLAVKVYSISGIISGVGVVIGWFLK
jgi:chromosome segregation ATPase